MMRCEGGEQDWVNPIHRYPGAQRSGAALKDPGPGASNKGTWPTRVHLHTRTQELYPISPIPPSQVITGNNAN